MGIPLCVVCCFSLAAYIRSLCLIFISLINMCFGMFILYGPLQAFWTWVAISFPMLGKFFNYNLLKYLLTPFLFLSFFWEQYNLNVGVLSVVPEASETVLISFYSFFIILLCFSYFHHSIFQLTYLFLCLSYLPLAPSSVFLISVIELFIDDCLFIFSRIF